MRTEDRLRESMHRAAGPVAPSPDAWTSIELGVERRRRRANALRVGGGAVAALAFVAAVTWGGLSLRSRHQVVGPPQAIVVSHIRVFAQPHFAKVGGVVTNDTDHAVGVSISCRLHDAAGKPVGTVSGGVPFIRAHRSSPDQTIAAGTTKGMATAAACTPALVAPTPPTPPPAPTFQPAGTAFFDAQHGVVVGSFGRYGCPGGCRGWIETTSDGGKTWSRPLQTRYPIVSVTVAGSSDAWAVKNNVCAYICPALLHSTDGGRTWKNLGEVNVTDPSFVSPNVGFALGYQRNQTTAPIVTTTDGGRHWSTVSTPCRGGDEPSGPRFVSATHGWIICAGVPATDMQEKRLLETHDGGRTWKTIAVAVAGSHVSSGSSGILIQGSEPSIFFTPDGHGWMWVDRGVLLGSSDGGRTWRQISNVIVLDVTHMNSAWFISDSEGFAILFKTPFLELIHTSDGGHTWTVSHRWSTS